MSVFFFFKQKTAYEMRISDWSSDVCSSDLSASARRRRTSPAAAATGSSSAYSFETWTKRSPGRSPVAINACNSSRRASICAIRSGEIFVIAPALLRKQEPSVAKDRSEEHTSELQSLMRISYAVFCLKKKNNTRTDKT